jgi:hypothetical protein
MEGAFHKITKKEVSYGKECNCIDKPDRTERNDNYGRVFYSQDKRQNYFQPELK